MNRWIARSALPTALALLAMGCSHQASPSEPALPTRDSLSLESVSPSAGTQVAPGSTVTFRAALQYAVIESGNGIGAQMQDQNGNLLVAILPVTHVPVGTGTLFLSSTFQIPASGSTSITITYLLYTADDQLSISGQTSASYPVGP